MSTATDSFEPNDFTRKQAQKKTFDFPNNNVSTDKSIFQAAAASPSSMTNFGNWKEMQSGIRHSQQPSTSLAGERKLNRNYIDSVQIGKNIHQNISIAQQYQTTNAQHYNDSNYRFPTPNICAVNEKRNASNVFSHLLENENNNFSAPNSVKHQTEKQREFHAYSKEELRASNDLSSLKRTLDPNSRAHHHDYDAYNLNGSPTLTTNYQQQYTQKKIDPSSVIPSKEPQRNPEDRFKLGHESEGAVPDPNSMKSTAMLAYISPPRDQQYQRVKKFHQPAVQLGDSEVQYESEAKSQQPNEKLLFNKGVYPTVPTVEEVHARRRTNFLVGNEKTVNGFSEKEAGSPFMSSLVKFIDGEDTRKSKRSLLANTGLMASQSQSSYLTTKKEYELRREGNFRDSTVLGTDKLSLSSVAMSEFPRHSEESYTAAKRLLAQKLQERSKGSQSDSNEIKQSLIQPPNSSQTPSSPIEDPFRSEAKAQFFEHKNVQPNKLSMQREQWLRSSSLKFQEVETPEFTSEKMHAFSKNPSNKSTSIFAKNMERNIFMIPEKQDYIFGPAALEKPITTNQSLMVQKGIPQPGSLGNKLYDLKRSHIVF